MKKKYLLPALAFFAANEMMANDGNGTEDLQNRQESQFNEGVTADSIEKMSIDEIIKEDIGVQITTSDGRVDSGFIKHHDSDLIVLELLYAGKRALIYKKHVIKIEPINPR